MNNNKELLERLDRLEADLFKVKHAVFAEDRVKIPYIPFAEDDEIMLPKRNKEGDIGYDAYAHETVTVPAHSSAKVPLGIGVIVPEGYGIAARTRGGRWLNGLLVGNAHVDVNYRGEIHALMYNVTDEDITIEKGERPCSIDLYKTIAIEWQNINDYINENGLTQKQIDALMNTNRGNDGFGSSGK